ncbi:MAG: hypothetical protein AAB263_11305 [Planctomycetota bacterium]
MAPSRGSSRVNRVAVTRSRWPLVIMSGVVVIAVLVGIGSRHTSAPSRHRSLAEVVAAIESGDTAALSDMQERALPVDIVGAELRVRLARAIKPLLVRGADRELVVTALIVASRQSCDGLAMTVVELARSWPETIRLAGELEVTASLIQRLAPADPARAAEAGQVLRGVADLIDGGNDGRLLGLHVLTHLSDPALAVVPELSACLTSLQRLLPHPAGVAALRSLTASVFRNSDLANQLGDDATHWISYMKIELERHRQLVEIRAWLVANGTADRVADGVPKLEAHLRFLDEAGGLCDGWLADTSWSKSFATNREELAGLAQRIKQAQAVTRTALAGARIGSGKKR